MILVLFKKRGRHPSLAVLVLLSLVVLSLLLAACDSGSTTTPPPGSNSTSIASPTDLLTPGVLTVGSDTHLSPPGV